MRLTTFQILAHEQEVKTSDYERDNGKGYEDEEYDEYCESDYYDLIQENDDYAEALLRSEYKWFYNEESQTIGDTIRRIY